MKQYEVQGTFVVRCLTTIEAKNKTAAEKIAYELTAPGEFDEIHDVEGGAEIVREIDVANK